MSAIKYTPGPWETRFGATDQVFVADGGPRICVVMPKHQEPYRAYAEDAANARLISAAPELLEALQRVVKADDDQALDSGDIDVARAAIAKATGSDA